MPMIDRDDVDGVTVLRMAHGKVNAFDLEFLAAIRDAFVSLDDEPYAGVVLTGTGSAFSAGVDLRRLVAGGADYVREFLPLLDQAFEAVFDVARPVVAAVNGHALAGGFVLMSACDERLLTDGRAKIGLPEVRVGVPFPAVPLEIVRFATPALAQHFVTTGRSYTTAEIVGMGFAAELVASDDLLTVAVARARDLADSIPVATFALTKRQLRAEAHERIRLGRETTEAEVVDVWTSDASLAWIERYLSGVTGR
jgi:enoyl-CoA hydratase